MTTDRTTVRIFDTTLRDGEQSPGATMNVEEKVLIARQLEKLNVDVIEAGFAVSSPGDFDSVARVAEAVTKPIVLSLSRTREPDIKQAIKSVEKAKHPGIHIFIATSDLHLQRKLMMSRQEALDAACWAVEYAKKYLDYIEFSAEDASRSDPEYLIQVFAEVIKRGAGTINVPDTTGYAVPDEFGQLFKYLIANTPGNDRVCWSAHCHNDLGMAVANSLAAALNGARQIECTINGIGERAGNAALEEVVMALRTRADIYGFDTNIKTEEIYKTSKMVSRLTGMPVQPNKSVVGANAFAHASGIHQDAILKNESTFGIMTPSTIGIPGHELILTSRSGRHAISHRLADLGFKVSDAEMAAKLYPKFLQIADKKKEVFDEDLIAMMEGEGRKGKETR